MTISQPVKFKKSKNKKSIDVKLKKEFETHRKVKNHIPYHNSSNIFPPNEVKQYEKQGRRVGLLFCSLCFK